MKRRTVLVGGSMAAMMPLAAPALAQSTPKIRWRMTSSYPKTLDTIYGAGEVFTKAVSELTDGNFNIQLFAAGEIVPGLQAADAVANGTVEAAHTSSFFYTGKDPCYAIATGLPFGLNARQQTAWWMQGGGAELMQPFFADQKLYALLGGNVGAQMGGWFRKEITTVDDLNGLKFRIGGLAGRALAKLGVVPQTLAGGDIYPALERGVLDAAEWIGPYDDEKLGFVKVAKYYYYPAWWEGGATISTFINLDHWNNLPKPYQSALTYAASHANQWMLSRYDALNAGGLRKLVAVGAQLRPFPPAIVEACYKAWNEVYDELCKSNARFKTIGDNYIKFRDESYLWHQVADATYDQYMIRIGRR